MKENSINNVLLIDNNDIDSFINHKVLKNCGVESVKIFNLSENALNHLNETNIVYQLILIDNYLPGVNGFEFVEKFQNSGFRKKHGKICFLYSYMSPRQKEMALKSNIKMMAKPLTEEKFSELLHFLLTSNV